MDVVSNSALFEGKIKVIMETQYRNLFCINVFSTKESLQSNIIERVERVEQDMDWLINEKRFNGFFV